MTKWRKTMKNTLIFGHQSPDTDSIMASLVLANLEQALGNLAVTACRLGDINKETDYALHYFGVEPPMFIETIEDGQSVLLVDHNEFSQSVHNIEKAKIEKVIDHHRISDFQTAEPLFYMAQPVGCTCTILFEMYKQNHIEINDTMAGLMASAIISDTLLLKSPTTTEKDKNALEELADIAHINVQEYGLALLKAGTDLSSYTPKELIALDAKEVTIHDIPCIISQVNTVSIEETMENQKALEEAMQQSIQEKNIKLFLLAITDIMNSNSQIIVLGEKASLAEKAFNITLENNTAFLPGVVSRKKQILPNLQNSL